MWSQGQDQFKESNVKLPDIFPKERIKFDYPPSQVLVSMLVEPLLDSCSSINYGSSSFSGITFLEGIVIIPD